MWNAWPNTPTSVWPGRIVGTRELVIPSTPFIIPYRIEGELLELLAVLHGRQKWPKRF